MLVQQLPQHRDEDVDRVGRPSLRVAQQATFGRAHRRVERTVHLRTAVDQINGGFHCGSDGGTSRICTISLAVMRTRAAGAVVMLALVATTAATASCTSGGVFRQYEYEEELYISLDG